MQSSADAVYAGANETIMSRYARRQSTSHWLSPAAASLDIPLQFHSDPVDVPDHVCASFQHFKITIYFK